MNRLIRRWTFVLFALLLLTPVMAQGPVRAVVVNEFANIRTVPAIGAPVIDTVAAGHEFTIITARSGDDQWLRVNFMNQEGWVNLAPLVVLEGDIAALPVADPRSIPYGGFEAPRAGSSTQSGPITARATDGLRIRAGPSTAYPTISNINFNQFFTLTGRAYANAWFQVSFEGTLGWVSSQFVELQGPADLNSLPIDGIVADAPPLSEPTGSNYIDTLKLMLSRLDIAQFSLDAIRASWTDSALTGRAQCSSYPPRPSDLPIPVPLLAAFYNVLQPLQRDFNNAMATLREAIDLFILVCNQPGTGNPVGTATVQGALAAVNMADAQFADLRQRLLGLIPPDREVGPNDCLFAFRGQAEILPIVQLSVIYLDSMDPRNSVRGYCFDAIAGQTLYFETLQLPRSTLIHFLSVSPIDNPTNFIAVGRGLTGSDSLRVSPVLITQTGRYILIVADLGGVSQGDYALLIQDITGRPVIPNLFFDPTTGQVSARVTGEGAIPGVVPTDPDAGVSCPPLAFITCEQLFTCDEALACLAEGHTGLDPEGNGVPCQNTLCTVPQQ